MLSPLFSHLLIPFIIAMFLATTMGGSGTGPSFSAAYGANVIRRNLIPGLFGIMVFIGAIVAGKGTASTVERELVYRDGWLQGGVWGGACKILNRVSIRRSIG